MESLSEQLQPAFRRHKAARRIALVAYTDCQILDVTGPLEVFANATRSLRHLGLRDVPAYEVEILADTAGPVRSSALLDLVAARSYRSVRTGLDTLLIAGGTGSRAQCRNQHLLDWIRRMAPRLRRLGSVCTGALILAQTGLLHDRRATTHWASCARMAEWYPTVRVEADKIYVRDGNIYTSAGVTSGMDLALALVEEDWGREVALYVARNLVLFLRRPGGQSQFSQYLVTEARSRGDLRDLQSWILGNPAEPHSVTALAERAGMSPRNFARVFARETGITPAKFVEQARIDWARRRLEETAEPIDTVAHAAGFGTAESMRRSFHRSLGVSPNDYRGRFRTAA